MKKFEISLSSVFRDELKKDASFIRDEYGDYLAAEKLVLDIIAAINDRASSSPDAYAIFTSIPRLKNEYRVINIRRRMVFYTVSGNVMKVEFMRHVGWNGGR